MDSRFQRDSRRESGEPQKETGYDDTINRLNRSEVDAQTRCIEIDSRLNLRANEVAAAIH